MNNGNRRIKIINPEQFRKAVNDIGCNSPFGHISAEDFELPFFDIEPTEGYERSEKFPMCCDFHKSVVRNTSRMFEQFPNCCESHKKLNGQSWFNKENYKNVVDKVVDQMAYTENHISKNISNEDWEKDITDYFEANIASFGQLPYGYGAPVGLIHYFDSLKHFIANAKTVNLTKEKRRVLTKYLTDYEKQTRKNVKSSETDINVLYTVYKKWLGIFPFELSYFAKAKTIFTKKLPFLDGKPEYNKYLKTGKANLHTKASLIEVLIKLTNNLITQINVAYLFEKGLLTEPDKVKLELIIESRKMKLNQGYVNKSANEEQRYRSILKEWFNDEKKFLDEIKPLLSKEEPQNDPPVDSTNTSTDGVKDVKYNTQIFQSPKGFLLFEALKDNIVEVRTALADYSFIFWKLKNDNFIFPVSNKTFIDFLSKEYDVSISKIKTLSKCVTAKKNRLYSTYKGSIK